MNKETTGLPVGISQHYIHTKDAQLNLVCANVVKFNCKTMDTNYNSDSSDEEVPQLLDTTIVTGDKSNSNSNSNSVNANKSAKRIPVTILCGFLGSGKTTLLNYILTNNEHGKRIAIIENEFSEGLGVESMIAKSGVDGENITNFFELPNGCICCTIKDDLLVTLEQLAQHTDKFDYIIIETTGLANPGPVVSVFWTDEELDSNVILDGVVCLVDSYNILNYLVNKETSSDVTMQISYADRIILNKTDLVSEKRLEEVYNTVVGINSIATIHKSSYSKVDLDSVLDIGAYNLSNVEKFNSSTDFVRCQPCLPTVSSVPSKRNILQFKDIQRNDNDHIKNDIQTKSLSIAGKFNRKKLEVVLDELLFSDVDSNSSHEKNDRKLEEVSSLTNEDLPMIIYRLKAIIHTDSSTNLCIVQAVHNIFDVKVSSFVSGGKGDTTNGNNPFVIIGKNINLTLVEERLRTCLI